MARRGPEAGSIVFGGLVVAVGVVFLLDQQGTLDAGDTFATYWPVALIALGVGHIIEHPQDWLGFLVLTGAGALFLLSTTDVIEGSVWSYVWPVAIILFGASLILGAARRARASGDDADTFRTSAFLSGSNVKVTSRAFRGGMARAFMGGVQVDLREAAPAPGGADVGVSAIMGGVEILVPEGWRVTVRGTPVLGGYEDKTSKDVPPDAPELRVAISAFMGGAEIRHKRA